jgi:hypothetical protein
VVNWALNVLLLSTVDYLAMSADGRYKYSVITRLKCDNLVQEIIALTRKLFSGQNPPLRGLL